MSEGEQGFAQLRKGARARKFVSVTPGRLVEAWGQGEGLSAGWPFGCCEFHRPLGTRDCGEHGGAGGALFEPLAVSYLDEFDHA